MRCSWSQLRFGTPRSAVLNCHALFLVTAALWHTLGAPAPQLLTPCGPIPHKRPPITSGWLFVLRTWGCARFCSPPLLRSAAVLAAGVLPGALADVYLHNPRGSNNRLDEAERERANANRLFDSQNNNRGGYNVGSLYYYAGSTLSLEWTQQHGCGAGGTRDGRNAHCEIVIQYMADEDEDGGGPDGALRDGTTTKRAPSQPSGCQQAYPGHCETDLEYGVQEPWAHWRECADRERNKGLFTASQKLLSDEATHTRQNPNGDRYGYECAEERDYYPYWHPTGRHGSSSGWVDVAVLLDSQAEADRRCAYYLAESENIKGRHACVGDSKDARAANHETTCVAAGGEWRLFPSHRDRFPWVEAPYCGVAPRGRDNHLGNAFGSGFAPNFNWTLPPHVSENVALRVRYNISTGEYDPWAGFLNEDHFGGALQGAAGEVEGELNMTTVRACEALEALPAFDAEDASSTDFGREPLLSPSIELACPAGEALRIREVFYGNQGDGVQRLCGWPEWPEQNNGTWPAVDLDVRLVADAPAPPYPAPPLPPLPENYTTPPPPCELLNDVAPDCASLTGDDEGDEAESCLAEGTAGELLRATCKRTCCEKQGVFLAPPPMANYSEWDLATIVDSECSVAHAVKAVKYACEGKEACALEASLASLGGSLPDPCAGTLKYLEVTYACVANAAVDARLNDLDGYALQLSERLGYEAPFVNNPQVDFGLGVPLQLAVNTAQFGRTFEDRSHSFAIRAPQGGAAMALATGGRILNLNVRGRRGNIVQLFPAVEYDFVPNVLDVDIGRDVVHIQHTGSNTNPNNDDGQGRAGTDRSNYVALGAWQGAEEALAANMPLWRPNASQAACYWAGQHHWCVSPEDVETAQEDVYPYMWEALVAVDSGRDARPSACCPDRATPAECAALRMALNDQCTGQFGGELSELDDAATYFDGGLWQCTLRGTWPFMSTRNNNFSNRSQKGIIRCRPAPAVVNQTISASQSGQLWLCGDGEGCGGLRWGTGSVTEDDTSRVQVAEAPQAWVDETAGHLGALEASVSDVDAATLARDASSVFDARPVTRGSGRMVMLGEPYLFLPHGQAFERPVNVCVPFNISWQPAWNDSWGSPDDAGVGVAPVLLYKANTTDPNWQIVQDAAVFGARLCAMVSHFSVYTASGLVYTAKSARPGADEEAAARDRNLAAIIGGTLGGVTLLAMGAMLLHSRRGSSGGAFGVMGSGTAAGGRARGSTGNPMLNNGAYRPSKGGGRDYAPTLWNTVDEMVRHDHSGAGARMRGDSLTDELREYIDTIEDEANGGKTDGAAAGSPPSVSLLMQG